MDTIQLIKSGKIGVLATDTIYGIHASALNPQAIENMYKIRLRDTNKPFIVLVSSLKDLNTFAVQISDTQKKLVQDLWHLGISVILPVDNKQFEYLSRNSGSIAFRLPQKESLQRIISQTGPLVSTSVNIQGDKPAETIEEAKKTFEDRLDFYIDEGHISGKPSTVVRLAGDKVEIIRQGASVVPTEYLIK